MVCTPQIGPFESHNRILTEKIKMSETQNIEVFPDDFSPFRTRSSRAKETEKVNEDATTMDERNEEEQQKTSEEIGNEQL